MSEPDTEERFGFPCPKLSTGADSTLGNWRDLTAAMMGEGKALKFLDDKIAASENGRDEWILSDETQLIYALAQMQWEATQ